MGHTQQFSELTPGSSHRHHSWWNQGNRMGWQGLNQVGYPMHYMTPAPLVFFFFYSPLFVLGDWIDSNTWLIVKDLLIRDKVSWVVRTIRTRGGCSKLCSVWYKTHDFFLHKRHLSMTPSLETTMFHWIWLFLFQISHMWSHTFFFWFYLIWLTFHPRCYKCQGFLSWLNNITKCMCVYQFIYI